MTATNYSYTYELLTNGRIITKEVGAREIARTHKAAWDFGRRQTRDPNIAVVRLIATDDPRVASDHPFWTSVVNWHLVDALAAFSAVRGKRADLFD